jgi:hypothetical protein
MKKIKEKFNKFLVSFLKKLLRKPKFLTSDLIKTRNGDVLYEVEAVMYDLSLEPVIIAKRYPGGTKVYSISYPTVLDYVEYKGKAPGSMDVS